jgi:hypothetical protein
VKQKKSKQKIIKPKFNSDSDEPAKSKKKSKKKAWRKNSESEIDKKEQSPVE